MVYELNLSSFVRTASAICANRENGRDAVHDAFVSLVRTRQRFRRSGAVEAWVWTAVIRTAQKHAARRRELPTDDVGALAEQASDHHRADELVEVREAIAGLPERQRLALFLRYYGGLEYAQIADVLQVKTGTVSAALHAAHRALRVKFEEVEADARAL
jgi:RNA polymerase sigma-70 factor, ECF subfamily